MIFNIKNKLKIGLLASAAFVAAVGLQSCDKEVTELTPLDRISESVSFSTPARIELAMAGVYDAAQSGFYAGGAVRGYPFGAANVEQGDMRGEDMLNVATFFAITYEASQTTVSANNIYMWHTLYNTINKANIIIAGLPDAIKNGVLTEAAGKSYEGEARFLRALCHQELLVNFARPYNHTSDASHMGVPYRNVAVNTAAAIASELVKGRNTVSECYTLMLEDLNFAEQNLNPTPSATKKISRATRGAAVALKTRILLHKGDFPGVITEGNKILVDKLGGYALTASPEGVFASNSANSESIFSIENSSTDNPGVNGSLPNMLSVSPGRALIAISPIMFNNPAWLATDLRRSLLIKEAGNGFFSHKYRNIANQDDWNPIIRLAEVVLNVAEAKSRGGATGEALTLLNSIRNRAVTTAPDQYTEASFGNPKELTAAILLERRIELLAEGKRWGDIHRLAKDPDFSTGGIPSKVAFSNTKKDAWEIGKNFTNGVYTGSRTIVAKPYDDFRFLWPIPLDEMNTNPTLLAQQNPGY